MEKVAQAQVIGGTLQKASTSKLDALIEDGQRRRLVWKQGVFAKLSSIPSGATQLTMCADEE